jgi:hypothetical protein
MHGSAQGQLALKCFASVSVQQVRVLSALMRVLEVPVDKCFM